MQDEVISSWAVVDSVDMDLDLEASAGYVRVKASICIRYLNAGLSETLNTVMQCKRPTRRVHVPGTLNYHHLKDPSLFTS